MTNHDWSDILQPISTGGINLYKIIVFLFFRSISTGKWAKSVTPWRNLSIHWVAVSFEFEYKWSFRTLISISVGGYRKKLISCTNCNSTRTISYKCGRKISEQQINLLVTSFTLQQATSCCRNWIINHLVPYINAELDSLTPCMLLLEYKEIYLQSGNW